MAVSDDELLLLTSLAIFTTIPSLLGFPLFHLTFVLVSDDVEQEL